MHDEVLKAKALVAEESGGAPRSDPRDPSEVRRRDNAPAFAAMPHPAMLTVAEVE